MKENLMKIKDNIQKKTVMNFHLKTPKMNHPVMNRPATFKISTLHKMTLIKQRLKYLNKKMIKIKD